MSPMVKRGDRPQGVTKMKLKVIEYIPSIYCHRCETEDGKLLRVDMQVHGDADTQGDPKSLIGKTFEVGHVYPFVSIASDIYEVSEKSTEVVG